MKLLLDTHFVLAGVNREMQQRYPLIDRLITDDVAETSQVSRASGKLRSSPDWQCQTEGLLLVTVDRALAGHRLAFKF